MAYNEDSSASGHDEPWIQWFCGLKGHEMFCEVERSYIEDGFNLYGLRACVSNFSDCLDLILDRIGPDDSDDSHLTQSACTLYGLIHARYIITAHGLDAMYNKVRGPLSDTYLRLYMSLCSLFSRFWGCQDISMSQAHQLTIFPPSRPLPTSKILSTPPKSSGPVPSSSATASPSSPLACAMRWGPTPSRSTVPAASRCTTPHRSDPAPPTTALAPRRAPGRPSTGRPSARPFPTCSS